MALPLVELLAGVLLLALLAYAILGAADFGGGVWDLLATGPRRRAQQEAIAHAMGPVWEANHVWLIFVIVLLFTGFPSAFALLSIALYLPWHLVLLGIVLRGAAFVFRAYGPRVSGLEVSWGGLFGTGSVITPLVLGMTLGAVTSGDLTIVGGEVTPEATRAWLTVEASCVGLLAVAVSAYLAAVFLTLETEGALQEDFRRRAMGAWAAVAVFGALALWLLRPTADRAAAGPAAVLLVAAAVFAAVTAWVALLRRRYHVARAAAVVEVVVLVVGWAMVLQYPYLIFPGLTLHEAAAPEGTLRVALVATVIGLAVLVPSLLYLFRVFKRETLRSGA